MNGRQCVTTSKRFTQLNALKSRESHLCNNNRKLFMAKQQRRRNKKKKKTREKIKKKSNKDGHINFNRKRRKMENKYSITLSRFLSLCPCLWTQIHPQSHIPTHIACPTYKTNAEI